MAADRQQRKALKNAAELLHAARKLLRIQKDIVPPAALASVHQAIAEVDDKVKARDGAGVGESADRLDNLLGRHVPHARRSALRENIEVFLVAAIVAMGVRTFFVQPFKIPTGSMQPTLYGITETAQPGSSPNPVMRLVDLVLFGTSHGNGQTRIRGDHIFVDKISYHFRKPRRGDVIVFETGNIHQMNPETRGQFYIKRLIALGDDVVRIHPPHVEVNGEVLDSRPAFKRIYSMQDGYQGYVCQPSPGHRPPYLYNPEVTYTVPTDHLFVLGDNSKSSSDGRYWGSLPQEDLVGRAFMVYWPFSRRFGGID